MSIMRCEKHEQFYDTDWVTECSSCENESSEILWPKVWRAMHDLSYKQITLVEAIAKARAAGHPNPAGLAVKTIRHGYVVGRDL